MKLTLEHLERMRIPELHHSCAMRAIPDSCEHKHTVQQYIDALEDNLSDGIGLLLFGNYSCGKSGLGSILLKAAASLGHIGLWLRATEIPGFYIDSTRFDDQLTVIERAIAVPLLVIDEVILFGDKRDWHFERLIRDRVGSRRATICTTNLTPQKFKSQYPAVAAVMQEAVIPIHVQGHDFRADIRDKIKHTLENTNG